MTRRREPPAPPEDALLGETVGNVTARSWGGRVSEALRSRVIGLMASSSAQLQRLGAADIRLLVQELDTHQVELEQQNEELRLAQLALAESRDRLSDLYEFAPVGYLTLDAGGVVRASNLAAADLLGMARQKLLGRRFTAFVEHVDLTTFARYFDDALVSERKVQCEIGVRRAGRAAQTLRVRLESIRIRTEGPESGVPAMCQVALIDITQASMDQARLHEHNVGLEQAVAERTHDLNQSLVRLRANEDRLALALDAGVMSPWTLDLDVRRSRGSPIEGLPSNHDAHRHTLASWLDAMHPDDRSRIAAIVAHAIRGSDLVLAAEYRVLLPNGTSHWFAVRGRVIVDAPGTPLRIVGVVQDVDERKCLEMEVLQIADRAQRRIGQELHDDIQQRLTGLGLLADSLCDALHARSASEEQQCRRVSLGIQEASERVNQLAHGLVPLELEGGGLVIALHRLACSTESTGRLQCSFRHDASLRVPDGFSATHLYRIAQEAVSNAVRHSGATSIGISLLRESTHSVLTVSDDGGGIRRRGHDGRGLHIMAYRASLIGATLRITNSKSRGTRVSCTFGSFSPVAGASKIA